MNARERVRRTLEDAGTQGATTAQLCQPQVGGVRFGARIKELRDEGYTITATLERPGSHRYHLTAAPNPSVSVVSTTPPAPPQGETAGTEDPAPALFDNTPTFDELCPPRAPRNAIDPEMGEAA